MFEVWSLAWPTVITMTSYTMMQFVDAVMVAQVGSLEVAAQGNGGIWSFAPLAFLFGITSLVNTFVSQNLGAGRLHAAARYGWAGLWFAAAAWLFLMIPYGFALPQIFGLMGHSADLTRMELQYSSVLVFGSIVTIGTKSMSNFFFGLHRPKIITIAAISGNIVNVVGNFILIYGEQGLPKLGLPGIPGTPALGVMGAAIATIIGTAVEFAIPLCVFLSRKLDRELGVRSAWRVDVTAIKELLRIGWPASIQFGNEIVCWAIFMSILVGRFGEMHMAAGWIVLRYMHMSFMPAVGFSVATTSLVGRYIGAGDQHTAVLRARTAVALSCAYMTLCGVAMWVFRSELLGVFIDESSGDVAAQAELLRIGSAIMLCAAVFQTFDAVGIVYSGALRGAGDTLWPGVVTIVLSWGVVVALGDALTRLAPGLESVGPWIGAATYCILLGALMAWRFERGAWKSVRLLSPDPPREGVA
ncbi:MAG: MATE family efflux transporter [Phycisphaerales bacterium]|nr:MATE family efflux transporter [Phycisphaerales bacterium]